MKKIIITALVIVIYSNAHAQTVVEERSKGSNVSTEDPHNPLVNGIPYSQYKAQEMAKAQQAVKDAEANKTKTVVLLKQTNSTAPNTQKTKPIANKIAVKKEKLKQKKETLGITEDDKTNSKK